MKPSKAIETSNVASKRELSLLNAPILMPSAETGDTI
jgi:hypothetical protein